MRNTSFYQKRARLASVASFFLVGDAGFNRNGLKKGILIVEDDPDVRIFLRGILASEGYQVFEAASQGQALNVWKEHIFRIDLLLTDICIPYQTTGVELAKKLRAEKPWLKGNRCLLDDCCTERVTRNLPACLDPFPQLVLCRLGLGAAHARVDIRRDMPPVEREQDRIGFESMKTGIWID